MVAGEITVRANLALLLSCTAGAPRSFYAGRAPVLLDSGIPWSSYQPSYYFITYIAMVIEPAVRVIVCLLLS